MSNIEVDETKFQCRLHKLDLYRDFISIIILFQWCDSKHMLNGRRMTLRVLVGGCADVDYKKRLGFFTLCLSVFCVSVSSEHRWNDRRPASSPEQQIKGMGRYSGLLPSDKQQKDWSMMSSRKHIRFNIFKSCNSFRTKKSFFHLAR